MTRKVALLLTSCAATCVALGAIATSCSVGEATTLSPCDPAARPNDPASCYYPSAACDDGYGYPLQLWQCCSWYAAAVYGQINGQEVPTFIDTVPDVDSVESCFLTWCDYPGWTGPTQAGCPPPPATPNTACGSVQAERSPLNAYELCITGRLGERDAGTGAGGAGTGGGGGGTAGSGGI